MQNLTLKQIRDVRQNIREARDHATMRHMSVGNICNPSGVCTLEIQHTAESCTGNPCGSECDHVEFAPITERNVSEFIRRRTSLFRETWIIGLLDAALAVLENAKP